MRYAGGVVSIRVHCETKSVHTRRLPHQPGELRGPAGFVTTQCILPPKATHLDVDAVEVETGLGEVLHLLAEEVIVVGDHVVCFTSRERCGKCK